LFDEWHTLGDHTECRRAIKPIPASYFPKSLTVADASAVLPDIFHTYRDIIIFSEKARLIMEEWAPGQVEFIPVTVDAAPEISARLQLGSAYYFVNVLGRAQRLLWLEMPVRTFPPREDSTQRFTTVHDIRQWKLRERAASEPLIWHDAPWRIDNREYPSSTDIFVEDALWRELDAHFPNQLNAEKVGQ
jgi:hypothetical protein